MERSPTSATGTGWERAVARDAAGGVGGAQEGGDKLTVPPCVRSTSQTR